MRKSIAVLLLALCVTAVASGGEKKQKRSTNDASFTPMPLDAGFGPLRLGDPPVPAADIIKEFTEKESKFRAALNHYTYTRSARVQTLDEDGKVDGEYFQVDDIVFDSTGKRIERVQFAPPNTLERISISPADMQDLTRTPTMLTAEEAAQYDIAYVGRQKIDEIDCYAFDVAPKVLEKGKRYFKGRIWVDSDELQIVVLNGKYVPDDTRKGHEDLSPPLMTWRQQIDGAYWFPVYTKGEGTLHFPGGRGYMGEDVHVRQTIKYTQYKQFGSTLKMIFEGETAEPGQQAPSSQPAQQQQPKP